MHSDSDISPVKNTKEVRNAMESSDDETGPVQRTKNRVQQFSDSDTESTNAQTNNDNEKVQNNSGSETETHMVPFKSGIRKSRIRMDGSSSDSDASSRNEIVKNEQQMRMINKRNKLTDKFKGLLSSRGKQSTIQSGSDNKSSEGSPAEASDPSDNEMSSIMKIKQKIKKSMATMSSICDPDTSDEEGEVNKKVAPKQRPKKQQKSTKLIEAKPVRMSAKQAMENMQLIKSESNRMLREKEVSLPYHRPKALSLKDIMSRRKPAVASDGKALPIKMNEEQLKHYALLLEQRQKEMMELCKSESDEESPEVEEKNDVVDNENKAEESDMINNESKMDTETPNNNIESTENESVDINMDETNNVAVDTEFIQKDVVETVSTEMDVVNTEKDNQEQPNFDANNQLDDSDKNDSNTDFKLVYNDSVEEEHLTKENEDVVKQNTIPNDIVENNEELESNSEQQIAKLNTEPESQMISLHYTETNTEEGKISENNEILPNETIEQVEMAAEDKVDDFFSDDDVNMDDIDRIIENAEILRDDDNINSPMLIRDPQPLNAKPKLMGAPGMVIDLDGGGIVKKLTGVELLKERFSYFARLKTPEELEREKEKKLKPGAQHLKLRQELEEKIAEQRSLEWAKRLEEERQLHKEMETILDDADENLEKIKEKLAENDEVQENETSESEEEEQDLEENDIELKDKPRKHNPMVDEEADESDCDENEDEIEGNNDEVNEDIDDGIEMEQDDEEDDSSDESESSESEEEETTKTKKGRILKAFEDSDEDETIKTDETEVLAKDSEKINDNDTIVISNEAPSGSQDDVIQLAQRHGSVSDDLFTSQESSTVVETKSGNNASDEVLGTQTFSILDSTSANNMDMELKSPSKLDVLCMSQPYCDPSLNAIVEGSQLPITQTSQSQPIGEDILALCTGKFYDNEFVSLTEENQYVDTMSQELVVNNDLQVTQTLESDINESAKDVVAENQNVNNEEEKVDENIKEPSADGHLKSILDELDDPEFDKPKPNKFFTGGTQKKETDNVLESTQLKKKFIIDSDDDEESKTNLEAELRKKKKLKKRKPEKRALHISDDEDEEELDQVEEEDYMSDLEEETDRLVEYDSEENEIEVQPDKPKKKRKVTDFFEQEAELTSEDEWVGSGDEDEKGLDRMEREEGDDEVFHQGKLRKELGQIHMRDVLDQDKREVRLIQELLFEDGDLGDGHRQRKFRWRNAGDDDETGTVPDEFADTQEEEFESEEQWRKQRHEREVFLRQMQQEEEEGSHNVSVNRTSIIKANLISKSMSTLLQEVNQSKTENTESPVVQEKKTAKDIPSPKKSFSIFQQSYHGSLLTRGRGALARLAALATPLAADDDDAPKIGSLATHKRNFVFTTRTPDDDDAPKQSYHGSLLTRGRGALARLAALATPLAADDDDAPKIGSLATHKRNFVFTTRTPDDDDAPKVTIKRKAEVNIGTPKLVKKMKIEEKLVYSKSSLLDHLNL